MPRASIILARSRRQEVRLVTPRLHIDCAPFAKNRLRLDRFFIETHSAENPFRERREVRSLFAPKAARVLRVLLQEPLRLWKVVELADAAQVSLGWVSAVRQQLFAREWAVDEPGGLRVTKPGAFLDAWAKGDEWASRARETVRRVADSV